MTTEEELCEMLLLIAHDVPLSEWPVKHRRHQFLRLVADGFDDGPHCETMSGSRFQFQIIGQMFLHLAKQSDPRVAVWAYAIGSRKLGEYWSVEGRRHWRGNVLDEVARRRRHLRKDNPRKSKPVVLVSGRRPLTLRGVVGEKED